MLSRMTIVRYPLTTTCGFQPCTRRATNFLIDTSYPDFGVACDVHRDIIIEVMEREQVIA